MADKVYRPNANVGPRGLPGVNPLLVTTLTGGTIGNIVMRSRTNPATCVDLIITDKEQVFSQQPMYYARNVGEYYLLGGSIPGTFAPGDVGKLVFVCEKTTASGSNIALAFEGSEPANLLPSAIYTYLPVGIVDSTTSWSAFRREPITGADNPIQTFESFGSITNGAAPSAGIATEQWSSTNETLTVVVDAGTTPTWPQGRYLRQNMVTSAPRHALSQVDDGLFTHGSVGYCFAVPTGQALGGRSARCYLRTSGAAGSETALAADLDLNTGLLKIYYYNGGSVSATLATTTLSAITGAASAPLSVATLYRIEMQVYGNRVRARAYLNGGAAPDWTDTARTVEVYQTVVNGQGYAAVSGTGFPTDFRIGNISVTQNYGDLKVAP